MNTAMRAVLAVIAIGLLATTAVHGMPIADEMDVAIIGNNTFEPIIEVNAGSGLRVTFLQTGLQKLLDILLVVINTNFREMSIPDQHMDENVPIVGHITLDITNIKVAIHPF
jgi:hypothetical protein